MMPDNEALASWRRAVPSIAAGVMDELLAQAAALREEQQVFPPQPQVMRALALVPFEAVRVVIVGQDPYHGAGQADGLAFSVPDGVKAPPSLRNIFKEVARDVYGDVDRRFSTDLSRWAAQGVLLLNTTLTVAAAQAGSHRYLGWERLTREVVLQLNLGREHLVFLLWGAHAQTLGASVDRQRHLALEAPHPSPLSAYRGFVGCGHFSQANAYLLAHGSAPIRW